MRSVFQEILAEAMAKVQETLEEQEHLDGADWDAAQWEREVREFTQVLGQRVLRTWAEARNQQAERHGELCSCGHTCQKKSGGPSGG